MRRWQPEGTCIEWAHYGALERIGCSLSKPVGAAAGLVQVPREAMRCQENPFVCPPVSTNNKFECPRVRAASLCGANNKFECPRVRAASLCGAGLVEQQGFGGDCRVIPVRSSRWPLAQSGSDEAPLVWSDWRIFLLVMSVSNDT